MHTPISTLFVLPYPPHLPPDGRNRALQCRPARHNIPLLESTKRGLSSHSVDRRPGLFLYCKPFFPFHTTVSCLWSCSHAGYTCLVSPEVWGGAVQRTRIALCPMPIKVDLPVLISSTTYLFLLLVLFLFSGCHKFERLVRCMLDGSSLCIGFKRRIGAGRRRKTVHGFCTRLEARGCASAVCGYVCVCVRVCVHACAAVQRSQFRQIAVNSSFPKRVHSTCQTVRVEGAQAS
jgi:hypothetical protein